MGNLVLNGFLQAGGEGCGCGDGGSGAPMPLGLRCSPGIYQSIVQTDVPIRVQTPGLVGAAFAELALLGDFVGIEFLYLKSNVPMQVRINGERARLESGALTLPTGFVGGETLDLEIDGVPFTTTFAAGDQTLAQVVARINAAAALAGLATPRVSAVGTTKIAIESVNIGATGAVEVTANPPEIPFATTVAAGSGQLVDIAGSFLVEFPPYPESPTRIEVSGQGSLTILAAGRTSA